MAQKQGATKTHRGYGGKLWRAKKYRLEDRGGRKVVEAAPGARWGRVAPFASYKPTSRVREVEAGPHLVFLRLKGMLEEKSDVFGEALILYAQEYGLLGMMEEDYDLRRPVYPYGRRLVAPEAVIDQGRIRLVDPAAEGKELLRDLLWPRPRYRVFRETQWGKAYDPVALPSDVEFNAKRPDLDSEGRPTPERRRSVSWEELKKDFGALMVLDEEADTGISVLCTREPVRRWKSTLRSFPSGDAPTETFASVTPNSFNAYLREVSPRIFVGDDGNPKQGWDCQTLLQAMRIMLYLDLTGDSTIRRCQSQGCPNHFRVGSQRNPVLLPRVRQPGIDS